jgi:hypothetical protein
MTASHSDDQKAKEMFYLEKFLKAKGLSHYNPTTMSEKPDAVLPHHDGDIGIEITNFYIMPAAVKSEETGRVIVVDEAEQVQDAKRQDITGKAKEIFEEKYKIYGV